MTGSQVVLTGWEVVCTQQSPGPVQSLPGHRACLPIGPHAQQERVDVYSLTRVLASGTLATLCLPESMAVPSSLRGCQDSRFLGMA